MSYPCTRCGLCCQQIQHVPELKIFHNGDGICLYLNADVGCTIYQERALMCRIDEGYQKLFENQFSLTDYYLKNAEVCNYMQLESELPSHYRVKLKNGQT
ncbi:MULTISPECIES: YkgJ family cysteine cluster protein [unclassified Salinivibrio]|uniref:YkgJ family cysteine cluster protein n=1 Tax=unclassified Salinivibrio TaxID=2636825 RepID=UPI000986F1E3|nr:zinc/iron-chelating domain-containing protein [Salinivibrio sp. PR919]OOF13445.1 zinc/iron-chelating domain-containing protein [Salinivibrio sp. PR932]